LKKHCLLLFLFLLTIFVSKQAISKPFFTVEWLQGKAWLQSPEGKPFISMGVNAIADQSYRAPDDNYYNPVKNQFAGDKEAWMTQVLKRLKDWHFNTLGCGVDEDLEKKNSPMFISSISPGEIPGRQCFIRYSPMILKKESKRTRKKPWFIKMTPT
jgi:hypothetical protein